MIGKNQAAPETPTPGAPGRHQDHNGGRRFAYDAAGERLVERAGSEYTLTLRRWDHKLIRQVKASWVNGSWSWSWEKDWVWGAGSVLATIGAREGLQQMVVDHQGSVGLVANRCGQRVAELAANPWGLDTFSTTQNPERHRYTGHLRDVHLADRSWDDFDYMHARSYFPYTGRFLSVDTGRDWDFSHPQSFNLYTYVRNNPVNLTDPDGRLANWAIGGLVGGGAEYGVQVVSNLIDGGRLRSFVEVDGRKIAASAALGAATSGLSALKIAGQGLSLGTKALISAAGNLGEAQVHAAVDGQALAAETVATSLGTGGFGEVGAKLGQHVARELSPKTVRALERQAKKLANIAASGRPRASQSARAAAAAERAAQYGAGPVAQVVQEAIKKTADEILEKRQCP